MPISKVKTDKTVAAIKELFNQDIKPKMGMEGINAVEIYVSVNSEVSSDALKKLIDLDVPFNIKRSGTGVRILFQ